MYNYIPSYLFIFIDSYVVGIYALLRILSLYQPVGSIIQIYYMYRYREHTEKAFTPTYNKSEVN